MQTQRQPFLTDATPAARDEMSAASLLDALATHRPRTLIFSYEGRDVLPGYHVTEVKAGAFQALDCGANYESWSETFIQLWDIPPEDDRRFMPVAKFLGIIGKVSGQVPFDPNAKLTFEVSDGAAPIALYRAERIEVADDVVRVTLSRRPASCKPRDRWLEKQQAACCAPSASENSCCS